MDEAATANSIQDNSVTIDNPASDYYVNSPQNDTKIEIVTGLARIMPKSGMVYLAAPYGSADSRIREILVDEGATVAKDTPVAILDNVDFLKAKVTQSETQVAVHEATLLQTIELIKAQREEAAILLEQAQSRAAEASRNLEREQSLVERGVSTQASLDSANTIFQQASKDIVRAQANFSKWGPNDPAQHPDAIVAKRNLEAAIADLALARLNLSSAYVVSPLTGTVMAITANIGQRPPADGIMILGAIDTMIAEAEIYQDRIGRVALGQNVELASQALNETLSGTISSIGLMVNQQALALDDISENTDSRVVKVLINLDERSSQIASRFTNLEALARIYTSPKNK